MKDLSSLKKYQMQKKDFLTFGSPIIEGMVALLGTEYPDNHFIIPSPDRKLYYHVIATDLDSEKKIEKMKREEPETLRQLLAENGYDPNIPLDRVKFVLGHDDFLTPATEWEHLSINLLDAAHEQVLRCPTWDEMLRVQRMFFEKDEDAIMIFPKKSEYVNFHEHTLHWWRHRNAFPEPVLDDAETRREYVEIDGAHYSMKISTNPEWTRYNFALVDNNHQLLRTFPTWSQMCAVKDHYIDKEQVAFTLSTQGVYGRQSSTNYGIDIWHGSKEIATPPKRLVY